jgi:protein-S-isoprenylcysteine O-methyltransferase Ste14
MAVLAGYFLDRRWPLALPRNPLVTLVAIILIVGSIMLALDSIRRFFRSRTSIVPIRPAAALVLSGPYRFTRNPMYLSLALLTIACGMLLGSWWPILLLAPTLVSIRQFVILPEERYLRRRFGAEYELYTRRVRRWV